VEGRLRAAMGVATEMMDHVWKISENIAPRGKENYCFQQNAILGQQSVPYRPSGGAQPHLCTYDGAGTTAQRLGRWFRWQDLVDGGSGTLKLPVLPVKFSRTSTEYEIEVQLQQAGVGSQ